MRQGLARLCTKSTVKSERNVYQICYEYEGLLGYIITRCYERKIRNVITSMRHSCSPDKRTLTGEQDERIHNFDDPILDAGLLKH